MHVWGLDLRRPTLHDVHQAGGVVTEDPAVTTWRIALARHRARQPPPPRRHWWRELVTEAWHCADESWRRAREAEAIGYATEEREFQAHTPRPRLRDFMTHLSTGALAPEHLEVRR